MTGTETDTGTASLAAPSLLTLTVTGAAQSPSFDAMTCTAALTGVAPSRTLTLSACTGVDGLFVNDPEVLTEE